MHRLYVITILLIATVAVYGRQTVSLNFGWEFEDADGNIKAVDLPHDYQIEQPWVAPSTDERADNSDAAANRKSRLSSRGFKECRRGTYRRTLSVPDSVQGKRLLLDFGGIMLVGDVYLNGSRVGGTDYGYLGFEIDVTDNVRYGADNELMVIADTGTPENSRWYTGGGLYRGVDLVITDNDLYFNRHGLNIKTKQIATDNATIIVEGDINARIKNDAFVAEIDIFGQDGEKVASTQTDIPITKRWRNREYVLDTVDIPQPRLWSCESPALYTARVLLRRADGTVADSLSRSFGVRTIDFTPEHGFRLNGKRVYLKGIANHHTLGALGAATYPRAIEKRIQLLKSFGFNHIRTSHNPYSEGFLDICDRYGMLVVDELYDKWLKQYAGGRREWSELWQHDIPEWVKRDRNHPSVIMWSLGNELQGYNNLPYNDWGVTAYRLQKTLLDKYDTSRPVTVAMHPRYRSLETDSLPAPLVHETDIAAYNYRYMYFPGDAARFPDKVFYQSEANLSNMGPNYFIPQQPYVAGLAYWGMIDYLGESLGWPAKGWSDGVFDIALNPKPNAWMLKSMFTDSPVVKIGVVSADAKLSDWNGVKIGAERVDDSWNLTPGDTVKVYTYTNADEVVLKLNNRVVGRKKNTVDDAATRNRVVWEGIPFAEGRLEAVAYAGGREVARDAIETAGKAVRLVLDVDNPDWKADGTDLQHITVTAVDSRGRRVPVADNMLRFSVEGDARIAAVSNGDITSDELSVQPHRRLYQGRALVILRAGRTPGPVTLTVTADGIKGDAHCRLKTK